MLRGRLRGGERTRCAFISHRTASRRAQVSLLDGLMMPAPALLALPLVVAALLSPSPLHAGPARVVRRATIAHAAGAADGNEDTFQDFERECFGDEDGCDAWFYGEDPNEEDVARTEEEEAALHERVRNNFEAGRKVMAERAERAASMEAARDRVLALLRREQEEGRS